MKTEWDYTTLADAYLSRPDYSQVAIDKLVALTGMQPGSAVCDVGAGVAHLTLMLAAKGFIVTAVEPNDAMRANGAKRTATLKNVRWFEGTGEATGQPTASFDFVTFGSSFNVTDRSAALKETARLLKPKGWFACMWNHRDLEDPIQASIENIIRDSIPAYGYGTRREDQTEVINASGLFSAVQSIEGEILHRQKIEDCVEAWASHATLQRQAGAQFQTIITNIEKYLHGLKKDTITIPYMTRIWAAQLKK